MKRSYALRTMLVLLGILMTCWTISGAKTYAGETLRYSCSAQVFEAFEAERIPAFIEATGINVELYICSSDTAIDRLVSDYSDIASTTRKLTYPSWEQGYVETAFCRDPLAVIANAQCPVTDISEQQLRGVFSRSVPNWNALGGPDQPILLIVPGKHTGAYVNFERQVMKEGEITYDLMTYLSTQAIDAVRKFPWSISFIAQGAIAKQSGIKKIKIGGLGTEDKGYPYYQEFSFVTKGRPVGAAKVFVDFARSRQGVEIINKRNMLPMSAK